jgi:hypothetical protein
LDDEKVGQVGAAATISQLLPVWPASQKQTQPSLLSGSKVAPWPLQCVTPSHGVSSAATLRHPKSSDAMKMMHVMTSNPLRLRLLNIRMVTGVGARRSPKLRRVADMKPKTRSGTVWTGAAVSD